MAIINSVQRSKYTDNDRRNVLATYLIIGNVKKVSLQTGIPARTIQDWMKTSWWSEMLTVVRAEKDEELDAKLTEIIHLAGEQIKDRILNGDYVIGNDKELIRKPMSGKDLAMVQGIEYDKRQLIRRSPTQIRADYSAQNLVELQKQFEKMIESKTIDVTRID